MRSLFFLLFSISILLTACETKSISKRVLVMGKGTLTAKENNVKLKEGAGYTEVTLELDKQNEILLEIDGAKKQIQLPAEDGAYILNLRKDTLVGARQNIGTDLSSNRIITQEELRLKIDSLQLLTTGANVKGTGTNFMIAPGAVGKISANINARIFGPFTKIPATLKPDPDGKELEIYKFYTNTEMRDLIRKLKEQTY